LRDPRVAVLERVDVALVVVVADEPHLLLLAKLGRGATPIRGSGGRRVDADLEQADAAKLGVVAHHADMALEPFVPQVRHARRLAAERPNGLWAVRDASEP